MPAAVWLLSSVLIPASASAQAQASTDTPTPTQTTAVPPIPPGPLTLDQVLSLAEPRSEAVSIAVAAVRRSEGDQIRAKSGLRPQLSAVASYDRALASEFDGVFDTTDTGPACPPFALNPTAAIDARVAEIERAIDCGAVGGGGFFGSTGDLSDLPFGRKNTWRASLSFSQNLYSGGRNGAQISLAAAGHETAQLGLTTTRAQLLFEVAQAYYDAVLSEQLVNIAAATLEQAGATLRQVEAGLNAGTQPEFEVLRARVTRDQQQPVLIRQRVNRALAYLRLKRLLDLPPEADLQLANSLEDENLPPSPSFVERVSVVENALRSNEAADLSVTSGLSLPPRVAVDQARATVRTREASLQLIEAEKMPSVSLNSNYARIAYPENVAAPTFNRSNWSVGISMSVPILTGGRQRGDEQVARAELDQSLLQQRQMEELAALDTRSAWAELLASRVAWESTAGTVQQANRAYEIADVRYGAGVSTQLELSDARVQRQQAEANRAVAARDLQVARARVALLPDLPVGNAIPGAAPIIPQQTAPGAVPGQPAPQNNGQFRNASAQFTQPQAGTR
jgi:outer membrane protein